MRKQSVIFILRLGLAVILIWAGFSQLFDGISWVSLVPDRIVNLIQLPPAMIILVNGLFEVIFGAFMAMDLFMPISAYILALNMAFITLSSGFSPAGILSFCLTMTLVVVGFLKQKLSGINPFS